MSALLTGALAVGLPWAAASARAHALAQGGEPLERVLDASWAREVEQLVRGIGLCPARVQVIVLPLAALIAQAGIAWPGGGTVALSQGLIEALGGDRRALRFVIGHELAHLVHVPWMDILLRDPSAVPALLGAGGLLLRPLSLWWLRSSELWCDRAATVLAGSTVGAARALVVAHYGRRVDLPEVTSVVAALPRERPASYPAAALSTHPDLATRLAGLLHFVEEFTLPAAWSPTRQRTWQREGTALLDAVTFDASSPVGVTIPSIAEGDDIP